MPPPGGGVGGLERLFGWVGGWVGGLWGDRGERGGSNELL